MSSPVVPTTQITAAAPALRDRFEWKRVRAYRLRSQEPDRPAAATAEYSGRVVRVGTARENDLVLGDATVSRLHFEIVAEADGFRLRDLGSKNGTSVDGYRVRDIFLRDGSCITAGRSRIVFEVLSDEMERPLAKSDRFGAVVGSSAAMRELFATLERVARSDATVLVEGETGTGKELVARAIHDASPRAGGAFVVFDAAGVPRDLFESALFGHERGSFTGASDKRVGSLEEADGGTWVIDELGELLPVLQPKLLRALESRSVTPVGSNRARKVDVRVIASTHRDLAAEVNRCGFREDLYYRLAVVRVVIPPLRERIEDVRLLVRHFVEQARGEDAGAITASIDEASWRSLEAYPWPGNVRELRNTVERSLALAEPGAPLSFDPTGESASTPASARSQRGALLPATPGLFLERKRQVVAEFEDSYLRGMLARHQGNISRAAAEAGLDRMYFKRLMKKHDI
jgi:DNA-binding NtrC family response regulator